jgi:hypothetical protein
MRWLKRDNAVAGALQQITDLAIQRTILELADSCRGCERQGQGGLL